MVERSEAESKPHTLTRRSLTLAALAAGLTACAPESRAVPPVIDSFTSPPPIVSVGPSATPTEASTTAAPAPAPSSASPASPTSERFGASTDPGNPLVVVNKRLPLNPIDFVPQLTTPRVQLATSGESTQVNPTTARAAEAMFAAAAVAGSPMTLLSGYRSYATQASTYNGWVAREGKAMADVASARPGFSEHQTGWAFDIGAPGGTCSVQPCFKDTPAAQWAAAHGHEFGFIVRYPWWFHETTGYYYEPWHLRYIGVEAATAMHVRGANTLEEFLGLPAAPAY
ncbi:M15 family metallopeptidase [Sinomonas sp. ASV486]|uniref:M15 family metallopeptidase n=1 Tax=Sinomonas sp. ASV486 TaxID=3051170 RepID=UPI0027DB2745|nr:M15 family metallopeptidase [Sinomonas sp. ASV486]MDQ4488814.1 M15 family metallopeptidase [Sinomonas sp. ASV486]